MTTISKEFRLPDGTTFTAVLDIKDGVILDRLAPRALNNANGTTRYMDGLVEVKVLPGAARDKVAGRRQWRKERQRIKNEAEKSAWSRARTPGDFGVVWREVHNIVEQWAREHPDPMGGAA